MLLPVLIVVDRRLTDSVIYNPFPYSCVAVAVAVSGSVAIPVYLTLKSRRVGVKF